MPEAPKKRAHTEKTFRFDWEFIKVEALDALKSFFMPFVGLYAAATGKKVVLVDDEDLRASED